MDLRDVLSPGLPSSRDDEPDSLRDDILDELADHLGCAYRREVLRGADPADARRRVLETFGDPAAVARRLWLDAMRGKIMTQRLLVACCILLAVACAGLSFVMWNQAVHARRMAEMQRAVAEAQVAEARRVQVEMVSKLEALTKEAGTKKP